jgi:hypothetical protein
LHLSAIFFPFLHLVIIFIVVHKVCLIASSFQIGCFEIVRNGNRKIKNYQYNFSCQQYINKCHDPHSLLSNWDPNLFQKKSTAVLTFWCDFLYFSHENIDQNHSWGGGGVPLFLYQVLSSISTSIVLDFLSMCILMTPVYSGLFLRSIVM